MTGLPLGYDPQNHPTEAEEAEAEAQLDRAHAAFVDHIRSGYRFWDLRYAEDLRALGLIHIANRGGFGVATLTDAGREMLSATETAIREDLHGRNTSA